MRVGLYQFIYRLRLNINNISHILNQLTLINIIKFHIKKLYMKI